MMISTSNSGLVKNVKRLAQFNGSNSGFNFRCREEGSNWTDKTNYKLYMVYSYATPIAVLYELGDTLVMAMVNFNHSQTTSKHRLNVRAWFRELAKDYNNSNSIEVDSISQYCYDTFGIYPNSRGRDYK